MNKHIQSLDGLRAIAVISVMSFHYGLIESGWMGVQAFFVLSGYLITRILLNEKNESLEFYMKRFYWRRSLRIFPVYYAYLLLLLLRYLFTNANDDLLEKLPYLLTYTYNFTALTPNWTSNQTFTHFWSLAIEEQFYLFWPLIVFFLTQKQLQKLVLALFLLSPLIRFGVGEWLLYLGRAPIEVGDGVYLFTPSQLDAFMAGGGIAIFNLPATIKRPFSTFLFGLGLFILAGILNYISLKSTTDPALSLTSLGYPSSYIANSYHVWSNTVLNLLFCSFILLLVSEHSSHWQQWISGSLSAKWLVMIGKVSYGMYVYHWLLMSYYERLVLSRLPNLNRWLSFIPYVVGVFVVSYLSFYIFENQFIKLKDKYFIKRSNSTPTVNSAIATNSVTTPSH